MRTSRPCPPGNRVAKTCSNSRCTSAKAGGEDLVDPLVDLADDGEQVAPGGLEVLELGGQEPVPLLQRRELLQRQRVDLAQRGEVALGLGRPALLDGTVVGHRLGLGLARRLGGGDLVRGRRHRRGGPVLAEEGRQESPSPAPCTTAHRWRAAKADLATLGKVNPLALEGSAASWRTCDSTRRDLLHGGPRGGSTKSSLRPSPTVAREFEPCSATLFPGGHRN